MAPDLVEIVLPETLDAAAAEAVAAQLHTYAASIGERAFALVFDARGVRVASAEALARIAELEQMLGREARLIRVARVVANPELAEQATAEIQAAGLSGAIGTFLDPDHARAFAKGAA